MESPTSSPSPPPPQSRMAAAAAEGEDDFQYIGDEEEDDFPPAVEDGDEAAGEEAAEMPVEEAAESPVEEAAESPPPPPKRKRGRPPKSQAAVLRLTPAKRKEKDEEVVCFLCFDGGDLVLCDRRGCPKAYHANCVSRDESFFQKRGKWTCGWHICNDCGKAAQFMCFTCTYSLCKTCKGRAGFLSVRGTKGFCQSCYETIMLIESKEHSHGKEVVVDFDDRSSLEYLFKEYWLALKGKLSLTLVELTSAKKPWEGSGRYDDSSDESYDANGDQEASSDSSSGHDNRRNSSRKKNRRRPRSHAGHVNSVKQVEIGGSGSPTQQVNNGGTSISNDSEWASKELLEFVAHMKAGDTSCLSQFDVQALVLDYIKQNKLRDPRKKSQIICDQMLKNLFGKERVAHFEMLKLLESHFLMKEASHAVTNDSQGDTRGTIEPDYGQFDEEGYSDAPTRIYSDKRRKNRKKVEEREPQTNLDDYAAIDVHNINLIYLRRSLMEDIIDDLDKFNEKVIGSFVRIRIPGTVPNQDMYRLVQVIGTSNAAVKYKIGKKTTDVTLQILNLQKTEFVTVDSISNQGFTQEECQRLRQSIKFGLLNRLTVGEVLEKARSLQAVRVNDWLESEKLRLGHLRDRASEKGRRKELRECVERLQLLSTPEERRRRLNEVAEIHVDPKMDPAYESSDEEDSDDKKQDNYNESRESVSLWKKKIVPFSGKGGSNTSNNWTGGRKSSNTGLETSGNVVAEGAHDVPSNNWNSAWKTNTSVVSEGAWDPSDTLNGSGSRTNELPWAQGIHVPGSSWGVSTAHEGKNIEGSVWNSHQAAIIPEQTYGVAPRTEVVSLSSGNLVQSSMNEIEKTWYYKDPSGSIQGPFSMTQLRKWNTSGYFPPDMRIWKTSEKLNDSILLADALIGKFHKALPQWVPPQNNFPQPTQFAASVDSRQYMPDAGPPQNNFPQPTQFAASVDSRQNMPDAGWRGNNAVGIVDINQNRGNANVVPHNPTFFAPGIAEQGNAERWVNQPSAWSAPIPVVSDFMEGRIGKSDWEKSDNAWAGQPQVNNIIRPTSPFPGNNYQSPPYHARGGRGGSAGRWNRGRDHGNLWNTNRSRGARPNAQGYERQPSNWGSSAQSPGELWNAQSSNDSLNHWPRDSCNPPTPTPRPSGGACVSVPGPPSAQTIGSSWGTTPMSTRNVANLAASVKNGDGAWVSRSTSVTKQTDKTDGWGSWDAASSNKTKSTGGWDTGSWDAASSNKTKSTGGWDTGSWDAASSNKTKSTGGWDTGSTMPRQTDKSDGWGPPSAETPQDKAQTAGSVDVSLPLGKSDGLGIEEAPANLENWSSHQTESSARVTVSSGTGECNETRNTSQILQDCPSPTPLSEREGLLAVNHEEQPPASVSPVVGMNAPATAPHVENNLQSVSTVKTEDVPGKGYTTETAVQNDDLLPPSVVDVKVPSPVVMSTADDIALESAPAKILKDSSEPNLAPEFPGWDPSVQKREHDGSIPNSPLKTWKENQAIKIPDSNDHEWSLPSPTPCTNDSGLNTNTDHASNMENNQWVSSNGIKQKSLSQLEVTASVEPQQKPAEVGWGSDSKDVQSTGWDHLIPKKGNETVPGNPNTGWGSEAKASLSTGWGSQSAPANTNATAGLEPAVLERKSENTGWGRPTPEHINANSCWEASSQERTNPNNGWRAPAQGNPIHPGWGMAAQGSPNSNPSWGNTRQNQNPNWGTSAPQGTPNTNADWGSGDGNSHWNRGGFGSRNGRMQPGGGVSLGPPPPRGQGQRGICKFHESGYCKKGSSCNYLHT